MLCVRSANLGLPDYTGIDLVLLSHESLGLGVHCYLNYRNYREFTMRIPWRLDVNTRDLRGMRLTI
jgi:hypothetical protein